MGHETSGEFQKTRLASITLGINDMSRVYVCIVCMCVLVQLQVVYKNARRVYMGE